MVWRAGLFLLLVAVLVGPGCGDDDDGATDVDAGMADGGGAMDAGGGSEDAAAGEDAGTDAGPEGCTEGCSFVEVTAGSNFSCGLRENGTALCWGSNEFGQLGDGRMRHGFMDCRLAGEIDPVDCVTPVQVDLEDIAQIDARGSLSACARVEGGDVYCWGWTSVSPEGGSDLREKRFTPEMQMNVSAASDVTDGFATACVIDDGTLKCWGTNDAGAVGQGDTTEVRMPEAVVGELTGVVDVEASIYGGFVCARSDTTVWCWGSNENGQFGDGNTTHDSCDLPGGAGTFDCAFAPVEIANLSEEPFGGSVTELALGAEHTCAIRDDGTLWCWGQGTQGALGQGDRMARKTPVQVASETLVGVTDVTAGAGHTCALLEGGEVWCWGMNDEGQLGDGENDHDEECGVGDTLLDCSTTPVQVAGIDDATAIEAGAFHTCAIRAEGTEVWCWGYNALLQLGDGTRDRRFEPVQVMGLD